MNSVKYFSCNMAIVIKKNAKKNFIDADSQFPPVKKEYFSRISIRTECVPNRSQISCFLIFSNEKAESQLGWKPFDVLESFKILRYKP